jgi:Protein  of unknown function (DUF3018)
VQLCVRRDFAQSKFGYRDTRREDFAEECRRQSLLLCEDSQETEVLDFMEASMDTKGWE